ncbi:MAG: ferritin-like domain-containing protein [Myxococcota bacterium]
MADTLLLRLRAAIGFGLGLGLVGCGDRTLQGDSGVGSGDGSGDAGASTSVTMGGPMSTTATPPSTSGGSADDDGDDGPDSGDVDDTKYDVGAPLDVGTQPDDGYDCHDPQEPPPFSGEACQLDAGWAATCKPPQPGRGCGPVTDIEVESLEVCAGVTDSCWGFYESCGPTVLDDGSCCYWGSLGQLCPGRPFTVAGRARLASLTPEAHWCDAEAPAAAAPAHLSKALAAAWRYDAIHEHAAVASFSRFALQLLAVAAPPRLVEGALQAAIDEREHAGLFFALARHYGGEAWGPGPLQVDGALEQASDPVHIVTSTIQEGCIAETISAMQLQRALETAEHPALRAALARVLEQELRHVELAWSLVAWAYARGDERLRAAVANAFERPWQWIPAGPDVGPAPADADMWRRHGRLTDDEQRAVTRRAIEDTIAPAAAGLLRGTARRPHPSPSPLARST